MEQNNKERKLPILFSMRDKLPFLISIPSVCFVGVVLFTILAVTYANLGNQAFGIAFMVCSIFFLLLSSAFIVYLIYVLKHDSKELQKAVDSFLEQLNTFNEGRVRLLNNDYSNKSLERLQHRINLMAAKIGEKEDDEETENIGDETFYKYDEFSNALHLFIKNSSSFTGALIDIEVIGAEEIPHNVDEALLRSIRLIFSPLLITKKKDGSYMFYIDHIGSKVVFKQRCEQFIRSFNVTEIKQESNVTTFYSAGMSCAVFPFNSETRLIPIVEENIKKANPLIIIDSNENVPLPYAGISEKPKRALLLSANERFLGQFFASENEGQALDAMAKAINYYCVAMDFAVGGTILYNESSSSYSVLIEHSIDSKEEHGFSLFRNNSVIPERYVNPIFDEIGKNGFFFIDDISLLPYQVSERLQSIGAKSVIVFPIEYEKGKRVLSYFVSQKKKKGQDIMERECADAFFSLSSIMAIAVNEQKERLHYVSVLDAISDKEDKKIYTIDSSNYHIKSFSRSIAKVRPEIKKGECCYKAIMGQDRPCEHCPLKEGSVKRIIPGFGVGEQIASNILTRKTKDGTFNTILIEGEEHLSALSGNLYDKGTGVFNSKAFSSEINKEIRTRGSGIALAFRITNLSELLARNKEETADSIMRGVALLLQDEGYGNIAYRYDESSFVLLLKSMNKMGMIALAEEIANIFSTPLQLDGNSLDLKVSYASINYPNEASANFEMMSLIGSELARSSSIGEGYLCEVGRNHVRKANRKQYILQLLEENLARNQVETRLSSIIDTPTRKPVGIEFTLGLTGFVNEEISKKEFLSVAKESKLLRDLDIKALSKVVNFYRNYNDSTLKPNGIKYLCLTMSVQTVLSPVFLDTIQRISNDTSLPKLSLVIAVECNEIIGVEEELKKIIGAANSFGIAFSAHSFDPNVDQSEKLQELGFKYVRISRSVIQTAMFSQSANAMFIRMTADLDEKGLLPIVNHVVDQEQAQFCLDMAMPYFVDGSKAHLLPESQFITYLNFKK